MPVAEPSTQPERLASDSSSAALLRLALGEDECRDAVVLAPDATTRRWSPLAGSLPVPGEQLQALIGWLEAGDDDSPVSGETMTAYPLRGAAGLVGVLIVVSDCELTRSDTHRQMLADLIRCLATALDAADARAETAFVQQSAGGVRRLFVEGASARDVEEAGTLLARVAAEAFATERAGVCVIDDKGFISFAVGVGVATELSDALASSLVGKVAAESPAWQSIERIGGPLLVGDARLTKLRPGGFVETMAFRSYAAIPLMSAEGALGMVICGDASRARTWTERERELAGQFALEAALIVDAARLRTSQREQLALLTHQANYDGLTGLANRRQLMTRLDEALDTARADGSSVTLLLLDINDFKRVNDTLGHPYGDELLREVGSRLAGTLRVSDTLARLGGDEFAVVLPGISGRRRALATALRIEGVLAEPVSLDGIPVNAVSSIGIAMFPDQAATGADLLQHADVAMYAAKRSRNGAVVYDASMDDTTVDRLTLYTELRRAITHGELRLLHQPKLDLRRDVVVGVESLVRWQHPRRGLIPPADFLALAESSELIHPLTAWVIGQAVQQQQGWASQGFELDVAVNVSARNLHNKGLMTRIRNELRASGSPERFIIEVTETAVMINPEQSIKSLNAIRSCGVRISMDDFGTGQSSLALLSQLPVDELKIDRQLVRAVDVSAQDRALVDTIIHLGHRLGLKVVAEGIETVAVLQTLQELGCDLGQGYFIARPLEATALAELVTSRDGQVLAPVVDLSSAS